MGQCAVRIQELDGRIRFLADIWKRFATGEEIDLRANYGFATKRNFARSMKIQELNYENIPVIEEKRNGPAGAACAQLERRAICANVGRATFVGEECGVYHSEGKYQRMQPDWLGEFIGGPVTHGLYMRETT